MGFSARGSGSDNASQWKKKEAPAASLSSRSRTSQRPQSPPVVATIGILEVVYEEDDLKALEPRGDSAALPPRNRGFDFRRAVGGGNSKGNGKPHANVTGVRTDERNPNIGVDNSQNSSGYGTGKPSPVARSQETARPAQSVGEGSSKVSAAAGKFNGNVLYRLYFKGLVSDEVGKGKTTDVVAGFGIAICDLRDNLLFEMKGPLVDRDASRQGAETKALTRGLTEALKLGIKQIAFFSDSYPIFQYVTGRWVPKQKKISILINALQQIRQQFTASQPVLVTGSEVKFAYKLARESVVSQVTPLRDPRQVRAARKEECRICYNDTVAERMFSVGKCRHRFCSPCVRNHVEVKLLHGRVPKCPQDGCKTELAMDACGRLLTPKLAEMWKQRVKEEAIPVTERVYCPFPKRCVECRGLFCGDCKVPWHGKQSCTEYKKSHPNPPADEVKLNSLASKKMWRQCSNCQHMIELTEGCNHITCRCGFKFCYNCGGVWDEKTGTCTKCCPEDEEYSYFDDSDYEDYQDIDYEDDSHLRIGRQMMRNLGLEIPPNFDPFFDLPDGVLFTPDMLSPKSRQRFYEDDSDDDSDDAPTGPPHFPRPANDAPSGPPNFPPPANDAPSGPPNVPPPADDEHIRIGRQIMKDLGKEIPADFDPFFDLPDGVMFTPAMLSPNSRQRFYENDESDDEPAGPAQFPFAAADEDCPYFGKYGKYTPQYDSDGLEYEDYTNPFHPDYYPQF
ncbi:unnamed protein product [Microthlaspi erraticum]|uniref:RBR-type E3 ubiquitin transferase n=1 Tax=Microthlaspi erraticum TaxID=1685480 RepID=A0A6D2I9Z9_9BRAS|nr:unnamed protein product [Microthlaspi erraticum]